MTEQKKPYANPYLAGVLLGLVLLASFLVLGAGLGASGGISRVAAAIELAVAPEHTADSVYFGRWGASPLHYYLVLMLVGIFFGGLVSAVAAGRAGFVVERGKAASSGARLILALIGGVLAGFASRLAQGCTSGQALTGGALLLSGSLVFLICLFGAGYLTAWMFRRQWRD